MYCRCQRKSDYSQNCEHFWLSSLEYLLTVIGPYLKTCIVTQGLVSLPPSTQRSPNWCKVAGLLTP